MRNRTSKIKQEETIVARYPKSTEEYSVKNIRVPKKLIDRVNDLGDENSFARIDFTAFTNEAIREKLERLEKRKSR